jgi:cytochrome c biogenesis protein CcmG/thiol:disulfide interchange protein DsbE
VTFKSLDGSEISLESLRGKVVLVNFWATWCEPCKIETPWMIEFQKKYGDKGFTILGVAMDDEGASVVGPFVAKEKFDVDGQSLPIPYPVVLGNDDLGTKFGGIMGLPTSFIITRDGKIATRVVGVVSHSHLEKAIQHSL